MTGLAIKQWLAALAACGALAAACSPESTVAASVAAPAVSLSAASAPVAAARGSKPSQFVLKGVLKPDQPLRHGDFLWDADGVAAGPTDIVVDLKAQILYVYRGGVEIGRSAILYGSPDKITPTGTFPIMQKKARHISNIYGAPMPYMLRLTNDGIAIHGSNVEYGYATHGCVGVPTEFAALLFAEANPGDRVLITNAWRTDLYGI